MIEKNAVESFLNEVTDSWIENQIEWLKVPKDSGVSKEDIEEARY